jgi:hypothetical protein
MDVLTLGGIVFDNAKYMPPDRMPYGGAQQHNVHKLPGGSRVYDVLGPDEADINFSGFILDASANAIAQALDAMRQAGNVVSLVFGGTYRQVLVKHFTPGIRRYPNWVEYSVSCSVTQNPALGSPAAAGGAASIPALVGSDIGTAATIATTPEPATLTV